MPRDIQARVDEALIDPRTGKPWHRFSPYLTSVAIPLQERLESSAKAGGLDALMDEFERLLPHEEPFSLRLALMAVLSEHPLARQAGVKLP